jgi:tetratricopeptide (TPR) repeat protein
VTTAPIALLPFTSPRTSELAGSVARASWRLAALLHPEPSTVVVDLVARVDGRRSPLLVEAPLSASMAEQLAALHGAEDWRCGEVRLHATGAWESTVRSASGAAESAEGQGLGAWIVYLVASLPPASESTPDPLPETLPDATARGLLLDLDRFESVGASSALRGTPDEWRALVDALRAAPDHPIVRERIDARIAALIDAGRAASALDLAEHRARIAGADADAWVRAARIARDLSAWDRERHALEAALDTGALDAAFCTRAGVRLVARNDNALGRRFLEAAQHDPKFRPLAATYLGVALARTGHLRDAIPLWRSAIAQTPDPAIAAIARENLRRAGIEDERYRST